MVGDPENPVTVWHKLANQFEKKPLANKLKLHQKFNTMCLKEGESVQNHVNQSTSYA